MQFDETCIVQRFLRCLKVLSIIFHRISVTHQTGVIFATLRTDGNSDWKSELLKLEWRKSVKISAFSLTILDVMSESWQAFDASKLQISFKVSFLSAHLKENWGFFLQTSPMVSMLRWFYILLALLKRVPECFLPIDRNYWDHWS